MNCLRRAGIRTLGKLISCTPEDLLALPAFGQGCLIEVTRKLATLGLTLRERRPAGPPTFHAPTLEQALDDLMARARVHPGQREALKARLGWDRARPASLQEAGDMAGVTRERMRQIQKRFEQTVQGVRLPALERAVSLLAGAAPTSTQRAGRMLLEHGLAERPLHPSGIERLARVVGLDSGFMVVDLTGGRGLLLPPGLAKGTELKDVRHELARSARPFGFIHADLARSILQAVLGPLDQVTTREVLIAMGALSLKGGWFYLRADPRGPEIRLLLNVLAVAGGTATVADLRDALTRRLKWRGSAGHHQEGWYPTAAAIRSFCLQRSDLFRGDGDLVTSVHPLDWRQRITGAERIIIESLMEAPGKVLTRDELERRVTARGMNPSTFGVYTTYSPYLKDLRGGLWTLRGVEPDPLEVERLRRRKTPRRRQVDGWDWLPEGRLRIRVRLSRTGSLVVGLPGAVKRYLLGRDFAAILPDGTRTGTVRVDDEGTSWGYGPALRRSGARDGELMLLDFDLAGSTVTIHVTREREEAS